MSKSLQKDSHLHEDPKVRDTVRPNEDPREQRGESYDQTAKHLRGLTVTEKRNQHLSKKCECSQTKSNKHEE